MNGLKSMLQSAFNNAKAMTAENPSEQVENRNKSKNFVEALAGEFRKSYSCDKDSKISVFSKHYEKHKVDFGLNELLFDICICEVERTPSASGRRELSFVKKGLWAIESEMAKNSREAIYDFNKLVLSAAASKLFIGPLVTDQEKFKEVLLNPAKACAGNVYLAFIPHPREWEKGQAQTIELYHLSDGQWQKGQEK